MGQVDSEDGTTLSARAQRASGGAVAAIDGRAAERSNHSRSLGCPSRHRKSRMRASSPSAQINTICAN